MFTYYPARIATQRKRKPAGACVSLASLYAAKFAALGMPASMLRQTVALALANAYAMHAQGMLPRH